MLCYGIDVDMNRTATRATARISDCSGHRRGLNCEEREADNRPGYENVLLAVSAWTASVHIHFRYFFTGQTANVGYASLSDCMLIYSYRELKQHKCSFVMRNT